MTDGNVVGRHEGIALFTVGQRRKLGVAAGERLYVVRIERETNKVVLGKLAELQTREMIVSEPTWTTTTELTAPLDATVKIRYRSPFVPALVTPIADQKVKVTFGKSVPGVCPGQAAVFFDEDIVVGGGVIER
jgi:tRNA-specific 2-thiouridylase